jgi:predicted HicB family RNase H-like nuclease
MPNPEPPRITVDTPIGPDVDLDQEDVRLADGTRLTEAVAEQIVEGVRRSGGRPSLSGRAAASPQIAFRVAPEIRQRAAEVAAREGKTISELAREALEDRVAARG